MTTLAVGCEPATARPRMHAECRVWERHPCDLEASCQPIAARGDRDRAWPGVIRDGSGGGGGLGLGRRFERGAGLAVEIPATASTPSEVLLARVVHATALPGGRWLLGCGFVSQLSDDELRRLLQLARPESPPPQGP